MISATPEYNTPTLIIMKMSLWQTSSTKVPDLPGTPIPEEPMQYSQFANSKENNGQSMAIINIGNDQNEYKSECTCQGTKQLFIHYSGDTTFHGIKHGFEEGTPRHRR